ncbi:MAG TPA: OsmC family protein [Gaiellales bacterium]|nr:OsmC family protein [Gaiellales bacterium]
MPLTSKVFSYDTQLEWEGGRRCRVISGTRPPVVVAPPEDFPGGDHELWSPEHLYLASLQSCTMLSFLAHCAHNGVEVVGYRSEASGELARRDEDLRYAFRRVAMIVTVQVAGGHVPLAQTLTDKARRDCFISASTTAEIDTAWRISE